MKYSSPTPTPPPGLLPLPLLLLLLVLVSSLAPTSHAITTCKYDAKICGCRTDNGYISLKKYADRPFSDQDPITAYTYFWNPCKDMSKGGLRASCVQQISSEKFFDCGQHKRMSSSVQGDAAAFKLDSGDGDRHSLVVCNCKPNSVDTFQFEREDLLVPGLYDMSITGDVCCPVAGPVPSGPAGSSGGLSVGSILLIVVLVVVIVYLVAGVVVQTAVRKAEGKDRIPNVGFWALVPGLIKDGFRFTTSCGKGKQYDEI